MEEYIIYPTVKPLCPVPEDEDVYSFTVKHIRAGNKKVAIIDSADDTEYTYEQCRVLIDDIAHYLKLSVGVRRGDFVSIYLGNCAHFPLILLAILKLGATAVLINALLTPGEVKKNLELCHVPYMICREGSLPKDFSTSCHTKIHTLDTILSWIPTARSYSSNHVTTDDHVTMPGNDVAVILYSSGTTGAPKAVQLTHHAIVSHDIDCLHPLYQYISPNVELLISPMSHVFGLNLSHMSLIKGITQVIMPRFHLERYLQLMTKHKVHLLHMVPPVAVLLAKSPLVDQYDVTCVEDMMCGAAPLSAEIVMQILSRFKNVKHIRQGYGMTETEGGVTFGPTDQYLHPEAHGTAGILIPSCLAKVIDPVSMQSLPFGSTGELCFKGPCMMLGYYKNPKASRDTMDEEGWLRTGDIGYYDGKRFFYVVDRLKELIKYKGYQVAPAELEALLLKHPAVADVGVLGRPDPEAGEVPRAWVVKRPGANVTEAGIMKFVKEHVAPFKQLRGGVHFVSTIPKSASGKIIRREMKKEKSTRKL